MSLVPSFWDPSYAGTYYHPRHRYSQLSPWGGTSTGFVDDVFDNTLREMHELERQMGLVTQNESGDFNWRCNVTGYR